MSSDASKRLLCAWTQDDVLARRSGYHVIANYLPAETMVEPRRDPPAGLARWRTRFMRRLACSRWCVGGSFDLDRRLRFQLRNGFHGIIHYLWCDRDLAFMDWWAKRTDVRLVGTFHHPADQLEQIIRRPQSLRRLDAIILMSETQRAWFLDQGVRNERLHWVPHGVDVAYFSPRATTLVGQGRKEVLSVGATGRNFELLREVAAHFVDRAAVHFVIVGPVHKRRAFEGMDNVTFHSGIADDELLHCYQRADCLLHLTTQATANNVLLEALACGTPVIAQRVGGVPEYLTAECSMLTEAGDFAALVTALEHCLSDETKRRQMSSASRLHAESLSWDRVAIQTRAVYESLQS